MGWGVEKRVERAYSFWSEVAEAGNSADLLRVGICFLNGYGVAQNEWKGLECVSFAAQAGASLNLAQLHRSGIGTEKNEKKALELFPSYCN